MTNNESDLLIKYINSLITDVRIDDSIPKEFENNEEFLRLHNSILSIRKSTFEIGNGNLSERIKGGGFILGTLKNLQASLKNLTWQTKAVASGDFTQTVDFLGEFSDAFNSMTKQLDYSIKEVEESKEQYKKLFNTVPDIILVTELGTGRILSYNKAFLDTLMYTEEEIKNKTVSYIGLLEEERKILSDIIAKDGFLENVEVAIKDKNNNTMNGLLSSVIINEKKNVLSIFRDATDLIEAEKKIKESEQRHRLLADNAGDIIWTLNTKGEITYISPSVEKIRGYTSEEAKIQSLKEAVCKNSLEEFKKRLSDIINQRINTYNGEIEQTCKDGSSIWIGITMSAMYSKDNEFVGVIGVSRDISKRKAMEAIILNLSITDKLTQLNNRLKIEESLDLELKRASRCKSQFALIIADIDHFKSVNDTYGHLTGDDVLKEFSQLLKKYVRATDIVGRWGGEEFIIISPDTDINGAVILANKIRTQISKNLFTKSITITASFGLSVYDNDVESESLIARADKALYIAKKNGRNRVEFLIDNDLKTTT